jgi:signal transduction histidine kinase/ActR/RegA family two-component response regulator
MIPTLVLAVGLGLSCWAYIGMRDAEMERATAEFDRRAANVSSVLTNGVNGYSTAVETIKNLTSIDEQIGVIPSEPKLSDYVKIREDWVKTTAYVNQIARDTGKSFPGFRGMGWAAPTLPSELDDLEFAGKWLVSPDFEVREITREGLCEVSEREEYFPVFYVEPKEQNKIALGIDLAAGTDTGPAIIEARDTGKTVSTGPIRWIKEQTGQLGFCVFNAVYYKDRPVTTVEERRENLFSVAFSVILIDDMLNFSLRGLEEEGIDFFVYAHGDDLESHWTQEAPVHSSNGKPESLPGYVEASAISGLQSQTTVDIMGRNWTLYCYPQPGFLAAHQTNNPQIALFTGILVTVMLAFYLYRLGGRAQRTATLVAERTNELSQTNENMQREIENRIEADKLREELQSQLVQTQKMESVGQLAGGIAHDFNNILVAIMGYSDLIEHKANSKEEVKDYISEVKTAADRAATLTSQLLAFSKRQIIKPEPLELNDLISDLINMLERLIPENIAYVFAPGESTTSVLGDSGQLEQVLVNLVLNARDAMPEGGTLTIRTKEVTISDDDVKTQSWAKPGMFARLQIEDTGHGIPEDIQERMFEPFFSTKQTGAGTGLGLSVVFGIVEQHGGFLRVDSHPNRGTTFSVYLPCTQNSPVQYEQPALRELKGGSETILVVEDDEQVRNIAVHILEDAGYQVLRANNGRIALHVFEQNRSAIDLVLLDVVMPTMGGRDVMQYIRDTGSKVPIIFASGYSDDGIHTKFILDEGLDLLSKPYSRESLLRRLRDRLDECVLA